MTDNELIQRLAIIEGVDTKVFSENLLLEMDNSEHKAEYINPIKNFPRAKSFCWELMLKHNINLSNNGDKGDKFRYIAMYSHCRGAQSNNPQRAVIQAIVEKHNEY